VTDLAAWADVSELTAWQAACLWIGVLPTEQDMSPTHRSAVARRLAILTEAVTRGELQVDSGTNPSAIDGNYERSIVARSNLLAYAKTQGTRPAFLFPRRRTEVVKITTLAKQWGSRLPEWIEESPMLQETIEIAEDFALKRELAEGGSARAPSSPAADEGTTDSAGDETSPRRKGRKPDKRNTAKSWLHSHFPSGRVPETEKLECILSRMKGDGLVMDLRTLRRAMGRR
jgi:hypothetical protein